MAGDFGKSCALTVLLALGLGVQGARAAVFSFDAGASTNAMTPLSITASGLTATFSSPSGAGAFIAEATPFSTLGTSVLANDNFSPEELDIGFSYGVSVINFGFATEDFGSATALSISLYNGSSLVASRVLTGVVAGSGFPEGSFSYDGAAVTRAVLTDASAPGFAIGAVSAPEPASLLVLLPALAGLGLRRRG